MAIKDFNCRRQFPHFTLVKTQLSNDFLQDLLTKREIGYQLFNALVSCELNPKICKIIPV